MSPPSRTDSIFGEPLAEPGTTNTSTAPAKTATTDFAVTLPAKAYTMADDTTRRNKWVGALESIFPHASSEATTSDTAQSTKQSFSNISLNDSHHFVGGTHQQSQIKLPGYWTHQRSHELREQAKATQPNHTRTEDEEFRGKGKAKDDTKSVSTFRSWLRRQS